MNFRDSRYLFFNTTSFLRPLKVLIRGKAMGEEWMNENFHTNSGYNSAFLNVCYLMWSISCACSHDSGTCLWRWFSLLFRGIEDSSTSNKLSSTFTSWTCSEASSPTTPFSLSVFSNSVSYSQLDVTAHKDTWLNLSSLSVKPLRVDFSSKNQEEGWRNILRTGLWDRLVEGMP